LLWAQGLRFQFPTAIGEPLYNTKISRVIEFRDVKAGKLGVFSESAGEIAPCQKGREALTYFYLANVVKDKKAQCLGYCQLVYILGHSLGLRVAVIEVLEKAFGHLPSGEGHAACFVELTQVRQSLT